MGIIVVPCHSVQAEHYGEMSPLEHCKHIVSEVSVFSVVALSLQNEFYQ